MHSLIIAMFLLNILYHSIGHPVSNVTQNLIQLQNLLHDCNNSFLEDIIKQNSLRCNINETRLNQDDLECFMFYDINSQLCASFNHSEFNLQENYKTKINETLNVASLCEHAKTWKLMTVKEHPRFNILEKVFNDSVNCQKLCGVGDLLSDDANYNCLYFKWGTDVIQKQQSTSQESNVLASNSLLSKIEDGNSTSSTTNAANISVIKENVKPVEIRLPLNINKSVKEDVVNLDSSLPGIQSSQPLLTNHQTGNAVLGKPADNSGQKNAEQSIAPGISSSVRTELEKPPVENKPPKKDKVEKNGQASQELLLDHKAKLDESIPGDDGNDIDDYDQGELPEVINKHDNNIIESDPNVVIQDQNNVKLGIESIITSNNGNHPLKVPELFPNSLQDSFTDDDDHFFPIFLTAIILVVLIYILYHNKSKFTKVILGLILEGRQNGRRRNSRGHAYRRLDTLEQAMSTNTAAPPSKIIY